MFINANESKNLKRWCFQKKKHSETARAQAAVTKISLRIWQERKRARGVSISCKDAASGENPVKIEMATLDTQEGLLLTDKGPNCTKGKRMQCKCTKVTKSLGAEATFSLTKPISKKALSKVGAVQSLHRCHRKQWTPHPWRHLKDALSELVPPANQCRSQKRRRLDPWVGKIAWSRAWQPTPGFLPGESHGQRSLVGYSL